MHFAPCCLDEWEIVLLPLGLGECSHWSCGLEILTWRDHLYALAPLCESHTPGGCFCLAIMAVHRTVRLCKLGQVHAHVPHGRQVHTNDISV